MIPGARYDVRLICDGHTIYETEEWGTRYRYRFHDIEGVQYVYSGGYLYGVDRGKEYEGRATCKKIEPNYGGYIRLSRVSLTLVRQANLL